MIATGEKFCYTLPTIRQVSAPVSALRQSLPLPRTAPRQAQSLAVLYVVPIGCCSKGVPLCNNALGERSFAGCGAVSLFLRSSLPSSSGGAGAPKQLRSRALQVAEWFNLRVDWWKLPYLAALLNFEAMRALLRAPQPARHADAPLSRRATPANSESHAGGAPARPTANTTTCPCPRWAAPAPASAAMYRWSPSPLTRAGCSPRTRARSAASCSPATAFSLPPS